MGENRQRIQGRTKESAEHKYAEGKWQRETRGMVSVKQMQVRWRKTMDNDSSWAFIIIKHD